MAHDRIDKSQWPSDLQGYSIGKDGYLVVSFDQGTHWYEIETARDVTLNATTNPIDTTCRRSGRFKENLPLTNELSVDAEMLFDVNDPVVTELLNQWHYGGVFKLGVYTDKGNGPEFYAFLTDMGRPEELEGVVRVSAKYSLTRFVKWWNDKEEAGHPISSLPTGTVTEVVTNAQGANASSAETSSSSNG